MTFFGVCDPTGRKFGRGGSGGPAATVGGDAISRTEFQRTYQRAYQQYQRMYQDAFDPSQLQLAHNVLRELVDERAMYQKAVELGLRASDDEILQILLHEDGFKGEDGKFSDENFNRFLDGNGYTEAGFMEEVRRSVTVQKLRRFVADTVYVSPKAAELDYRIAETKTDVEYLKFDPQKVVLTVPAADVDKFLADAKNKDQIKAYYDSNLKDFNRPEQVQARHILVGFKGSRNATAEAAKRDKAAAQKRAESLLATVKAPGADFARIARDNTDEPTGKTSGGELGWFGREAMDKSFSDAAFALNKGQISGVVESPFGFHIIQVQDKKAATSTTLAQAERQIAETLILKQKRPDIAKAQAAAVVAALVAGKPVDGLLKADQVAWASTGEVGADARYLPGIGASKEVGEALVDLRQPGQVFPHAIDVRGNYYVLRLKSRKEPDAKTLTSDKVHELSQQAAYAEGNALYTNLQKRVQEDLDKGKRVWLNPDLLALDEPKAKDKAGS